MPFFHLHVDESGESLLSPLEFPVRETPAGTVRGISDIGATTTGIGQFIGRKPDIGLHPAPRRQFLVILQGELEIVATSGQRQRLVAGDVLLADDVGSKGHISRDVGDEPLAIMSVGLSDEWDGPGEPIPTDRDQPRTTRDLHGQ